MNLCCIFLGLNQLLKNLQAINVYCLMNYEVFKIYPLPIFVEIDKEGSFVRNDDNVLLIVE